MTPDMAKAELAGKVLVCWCSLDEPCHCDVLIEVANGLSNEESEDHLD